LPIRFKVHDETYPHFITSTIVHWIPIFSRDDYLSVMAASLTHCISNRGLLVHVFVIMPHHIHLLCSQVDGT